MGTALILVFLFVIAAYLVAIYLQYRRGRKEPKLHFSRQEKERLAQEIEAVDIPEVSIWPKGKPHPDEQDSKSQPAHNDS